LQQTFAFPRYTESQFSIYANVNLRLAPNFYAIFAIKATIQCQYQVDITYLPLSKYQ
jgi:hypothetical protein